MTIKENIETTLSEIEETLVKAINDCNDEYELSAIAFGIAAEWNSLIDRVCARWTPKGE